MIRIATLGDLDALLAIEQRAFELDRFSRRTFRYLLSKANAVTLLADENGKVAGYGMLLFNTGTSLARLYSLAVAPDWQGKGIGRALIRATEEHAIAHGCVSIRLEVRADGARARALYESQGYRPIGKVDDYYEDGMQAIRYEKRLMPQLKPALAKVPFYEQTLEFTCGPSALMMAMHSLVPAIKCNRELELRLWRESTTIFMTSGHGGCGPYGLALAAYHRGFDVEIYVSDKGPMFIDSVRSEEKKEVMRLVQQDFLKELKKLPVKIRQGRLNVQHLEEKLNQGGIPLVLISSYRIYHEKAPHWVVVTGFDEKYIYVHDPFVDTEAGKTATDCMNMPIAKRDFELMARYGKAGQKAAIIVRQR
ncbi:MAG: peptidase C39 family protein, partial [Gammaproteobacteria bacterium]